MLFQKAKQHFSSLENARINDFYQRESKEKLKSILDAKRSQIIRHNRINIPGRKGKLFIGVGRLSATALRAETKKFGSLLLVAGHSRSLKRSVPAAHLGTFAVEGSEVHYTNKGAGHAPGAKGVDALRPGAKRNPAEHPGPADRLGRQEGPFGRGIRAVSETEKPLLQDHQGLGEDRASVRPPRSLTNRTRNRYSGVLESDPSFSAVAGLTSVPGYDLLNI